jgi:diguanylate cyclase (GGDEF)-like protein/PAS domain S-box-containing protein
MRPFDYAWSGDAVAPEPVSAEVVGMPDLVVSLTPSAVLVAGRFRWANPAWEALSSAPGPALLGQQLTDWVHLQDREAVTAALEAATARHPQSGALVHRIIRPDGATGWVSSTLTPLPPFQGRPRVLVQTHDLTAEREMQQQLRRDATHDVVTGLPNRLLFSDHLEHALLRLRRTPQACVAVLFFDLDRFKHVNDTYGHGTGDQLLASVAQRLVQAVRPHDVVARLSGDEFTVLLDDMHEPGQATLIAKRCLAAICEPHLMGGEQLTITASVGISTAASAEMVPQDLLAAADAAMYRAKENGRNRAEFLDEPLSHLSPRAVLKRQLRHALERGELEIHYQPIIDLTTDEVAAGEALLRWRHPEHGLLPAGEFISIAEEAGLIRTIGDWVIEVACRDLRAWDDAGRVVPHAYVNIAAQQVDERFVEHVTTTLATHGLEPQRLRLEITETELMNDARTLGQLQALHTLGCSLVIDDFGTGYSSLSRLIDLPVDIVKIDRSFISGIGVDPRPTAVVSAALLLAHDLRHAAIAEGVETAGQRRWLVEAGCTFAQGFGIGRPVPAAAFPAPSTVTTAALP